MPVKRDPVTGIEWDLAHLLNYGTWIAVLLIAAGLIWPAWRVSFLPGEHSLISFGVLIFIALPLMRVITMLWHFVRTRERLFALLALLVLIIIALGLVAGIAES